VKRLIIVDSLCFRAFTQNNFPVSFSFLQYLQVAAKKNNNKMKPHYPFLLALLLCLPQGANAFFFGIFAGLLDFLCSLPLINLICGGPPFESKIYASDGGQNDAFGAAVDLKGNTVIVGAPDHLDVGAAYVYERNGPRWIEGAELKPNDLEDGDSFGTAVATDGEYFLATAPLNGDEDFGAVYFFARDAATGGYGQESKFVAENRFDDEFYGRAAALSNGRAAIAAPWAKQKIGAVYMYRRFDLFWFPEQKIEPSDGAKDDEFGSAVAIDGDTMVIGAPFKGGNVGAVYIYTRTDADGWVEQDKLVADPPGPTVKPYFGFSVAVRGETIAVGAFSDEGESPGSVYAFDRVAQTGKWSQYVKINAADVPGVVDTDAFGRSVALTSKDSMVVAAPVKGSVYTFSRSGSGWALEGIIDPDNVSDDGNGNPQLGIAFGFRIAGDGSQVVVGARLDDGPGATVQDSGAAFIYDLSLL